MPDLDELLNAITGALNKVHEELKENKISDDKSWSRKVKSALCELVDTKKHPNRWVYASGLDKKPKQGGGEWLYDLCWLDYEDDNEKAKLLRMQLALESEWGTDQDVADDFQKLMLSRAALRVMVFGGRNETTEKTVGLLASFVRSFKDGAESDRYLLAGYDGDKIGFSFFVLDGNGDRVDE